MRRSRSHISEAARRQPHERGHHGRVFKACIRGCVAATLFSLFLVSACSIVPRNTSSDPGDFEQGYEATLALFTHVKKAYPSTWNGVPAEIYCIDARDFGRIRSASSNLESRIVPASDCRFQFRPGLSAGEQRVRHIASDRPAVIYTFSTPEPISRDVIAIDFTWFGAHHFSAGYRCTLRYAASRWLVQGCQQTKDYNAVG
jgi:hypothetical protein